MLIQISFGLLVALCFLAVHTNSADNCYQPVQYMCFRAENRFRYDHDTKDCISFTACPGTGNNFKTLEQCRASCRSYIHAPRPKALTVNAGNRNCQRTTEFQCIHAERRYRFDGMLGRCKPFLGCPGRGNNFQSYSDCDKICNAGGGRIMNFIDMDVSRRNYELYMEDRKTINLPFIQEIGSAQLIDGKAISIKGEISGDKFWFDLGDSANENEANYAIDISYRQSEGWVVNTKLDGNWQTEDRYPLGPEVEQGQEVYLRIAPYNDYFAIFANGQKIGERNYIMPLEQVSWVYVTGDLKLHKIQFEDNFYMVPLIHQFASFPPESKELYITMRTDRDAENIWINFKQDDDNVPFQLNPRFTIESVVRNTKKDGKWMDEERDGDFPFGKDMVYNLLLEIHEDAYRVFINGTQFCTYYHRMPISSVKSLEIWGDVEISKIST